MTESDLVVTTCVAQTCLCKPETRIVSTIDNCAPAAAYPSNESHKGVSSPVLTSTQGLGADITASVKDNYIGATRPVS